jgi:hypothetical protein
MCTTAGIESGMVFLDLVAHDHELNAPVTTTQLFRWGLMQRQADPHDHGFAMVVEDTCLCMRGHQNNWVVVMGPQNSRSGRDHCKGFPADEMGKIKLR